MTTTPLLQVRNLSLDTAGGRPLFKALSLDLDASDRVAVVGRNGVGKSSLLQVLAGVADTERGHVTCRGSRLLVPQSLPHAQRSPGQQRRHTLALARDARPDMLMLDEPTHDLDRAGIDWLTGWLKAWDRGLVVVSHDRRLLSVFEDFFVVAESGCHHFKGSLDGLLKSLDNERVAKDARYVRGLNQLVAKEQHSATDRQRRERKKRVGRVRELGRRTPAILLNSKRGYAQTSQAKRRLRREDRLDAARQWAHALRRSVTVVLPLHVPKSAELKRSKESAPIVRLDAVTASSSAGALFGPMSLEVTHQRIAITGRNGAGKTTLAEIVVGARKPETGRARVDPMRIGYIAQNASNWCDERSVVDHLLFSGRAITLEDAARTLQAHRFPVALAQRPLASLSPGERVRAALICLYQRLPQPELLVIDEPSGHLDFVGIDALEAALRAWTGGLIVVSHDEVFLERIGIDSEIVLG